MKEEEEQNLFNVESCSETRELEELLKEEKIGRTMYSKKWCVTTILEVAKSPEFDESVEEKLTSLTDMSCDEDVGRFLAESQAADIIYSLAAKFDSCRSLELTMNILSNCPTVKREFVDLPLKALFISDNSKTLISAFKMMHNFLNSLLEAAEEEEDDDGDNDEKDHLELFHSKEIIERISFFMSCSSNNELLRAIGKFLLLLIESSDSLDNFTGKEFVTSTLTAADESFEDDSAHFHYLRILDRICPDNYEDYEYGVGLNEFILRTLESREQDIDLETLALLAKKCPKKCAAGYEMISGYYKSLILRRETNNEQEDDADDDNFVVLSSVIQGALQSLQSN